MSDTQWKGNWHLRMILCLVCRILFVFLHTGSDHVGRFVQKEASYTLRQWTLLWRTSQDFFHVHIIAWRQFTFVFHQLIINSWFHLLKLIKSCFVNNFSWCLLVMFYLVNILLSRFYVTVGVILGISLSWQKLMFARINNIRICQNEIMLWLDQLH